MVKIDVNEVTFQLNICSQFSEALVGGCDFSAEPASLHRKNTNFLKSGWVYMKIKSWNIVLCININASISWQHF